MPNDKVYKICLNILLKANIITKIPTIVAKANRTYQTNQPSSAEENPNATGIRKKN